jgi:hypothetical protein
VFDRLDFVYQPSRDVAADLAYYVDALDAEVVFTVERFATRVAMLRVSAEGPHLLLAEHLGATSRRAPRTPAAPRRRGSDGGRVGPHPGAGRVEPRAAGGDVESAGPSPIVATIRPEAR